MIVIRRALLLLFVASVAAAATASATLEEAEFAFFNGGFVDYRLSTGGAEESSVGGNDGSKGTHYGDPADGCMKDEVRKINMMNVTMTMMQCHVVYNMFAYNLVVCEIADHANSYNAYNLLTTDD